MNPLRVKKGNEKKDGHVTRTIQSLPKELQVEIFAKVATRSILDHCMVKLCCKDFFDAAEDDYVYRHASLENFALVPLPWFTSNKELSFLKRCKKSGNSEILHREGMLQYFTYSKLELGLSNLIQAALEGHDDSKYVYSMLLMCSEDQLQRNKGFDLFCSFKASTTTSLIRCRKRVKTFVRSMWVKNNSVVKHQHSSFCSSATCERERLSRTWLPFEDPSLGISCECCRADYELALFRNIFGV